MSAWFTALTIVFILVSAAMVLIILVQRPQGGGLAGAFGGAGGGGTETVFGGRVGDALTVMTVIAFVVYLSLAVGLNLIDTSPTAVPEVTDAAVSAPIDTTPPPVSAPVTLPVTPSGGTRIPVTPIDPPVSGGTATPPASGGTP